MPLMHGQKQPRLQQQHPNAPPKARPPKARPPTPLGSTTAKRPTTSTPSSEDLVVRQPRAAQRRYPASESGSSPERETSSEVSWAWTCASWEGIEKLKEGWGVHPLLWDVLVKNWKIKMTGQVLCESNTVNTLLKKKEP